jgi:hypothetical protein
LGALFAAVVALGAAATRRGADAAASQAGADGQRAPGRPRGRDCRCTRAPNASTPSPPAHHPPGAGAPWACIELRWR